MSTSSTSANEEVTCRSCGKRDPDGESFARCSVCKRARYCSKSCQRRDWKDGHKRSCAPSMSLVDAFWGFVERARSDYAITEAEHRGMRLWVNRLAGLMNTGRGEGIKGPDPAANLRFAVAYELDYRLLAEGRGVRLDNGKVAFVVKAIGERFGHSRTYRVKLADGSGTLVVGLDKIHMIPLNDPRHWRRAEGFDPHPDKTFPPEVDPEVANRQRQHIPVTEGYKWEFCDVDGTWKEYSEHIQYLIETMYDMGSKHCLYTPGAPHCEGSICVQSGLPATDPRDPLVGSHFHTNPHDFASRQVVFRELRRSGFNGRGAHPTLMTERDLFTGMRRPVRRSGPLPLPENDYIHERNMCGPEYHYRSDEHNNGDFCGLCHSTSGPFVQTPCCGGWVCDTEDEYEVGSYEREGQCMRNHRLGSICHFHHQEGHGGGWKECEECVAFFHPYDYAVKASSMAVAGTNRRYNFDSNVRHDLNPDEAEFPTCFECGGPCDTTGETTRTLSMRRAMCRGKNFCTYHGGGFGVVKNEMDLSRLAGE